MSLQSQESYEDYSAASDWNNSNDWNVQTCAEDELPAHQWIPIEGIYGVYVLPSGLLWVLITETAPVYEISPLLSSSTGDRQSSLLKIRRIQSMELFHQASSQSSSSSYSQQQLQQQQKEEARQLQLLRQALKEHDFYFVPHAESMVPDMTRTLQRSFDMYHAQQQKMANTTNSSSYIQGLRAWWNITNADTAEDCDFYPDSRFFWNEMAMYPLLHTYQRQATSVASNVDRNSTNASLKTNSSSCLQALLDHVIPVTSAFCGVHRNLSVASASSADWTYDQILISRRSRFRAGTRFAKRGADAMGHVANYAETEQICVIHPVINETTSVAPTTVAAADTAASLEVYSHVQVRGSIPLRWSSPTDITTYRPRVRIGTDPLAQARAMWAHVVEQVQHYVTPDHDYSKGDDSTVTTLPQLVFCNLIDKKSDQGRLGRAFDAVLQAVLDVYQDFKVHWTKDSRDHSEDGMSLLQPDTNITETPATAQNSSSELVLPMTQNSSSDHSWVAPIPFLTPQTVQHVWFDFHAEVKGGKWDKLGGLLKQLSPTVLQQGFFAARLDGNQWTIAQRQSGVIRTNCMDCLDRTNVVQSIIGRYILFRQLSKRRAAASAATTKSTKSTKQHNRRNFPSEYSAAFRRDSMKLPWTTGEMAHRLLWADNADVISRLYAGTAALKGDFTRTGKRTKRGALDDGMNSLQRYYLNNFLDADRQEGIDLMVGQARFTTRPELLEGDTSSTLESSSSTTSLKEAVRAMMLGTKAIDDSASDERFHIRIKQPQGGNIRRRTQGNRSGPYTEKIRRPSLELRWLPGDLQHQMRSRVTSLDQSSFSITDDFLPSAAIRLEAMERRLTTEIPWWVGADSETDEDSDPITSSSEDGDFVPHAGHLVGALVAAFQAPLTTATMTVAVLGLLLERRSKPKREEDEVEIDED